MEKISLDEIRTFCEEHGDQHGRVYQHCGADDHYMITWPSGDSYEYHARGNAWEQVVRIVINGERENVTKYEYHNFGWRAVA